MRLLYFILPFITFAFGCSPVKAKHAYIKVISIINADSVNDYNKGFTLGDYFYYDLVTDSLTIRFVNKRDPFEFITYKGKIPDRSYSDTIRRLFTPLKTRNATMLKTANHCFQPNCWCNGYYIVYNDGINTKYLSSHEINYDSLTSFIKYYYRLKDLPWEQNLITNNEIDKTEEIVKTLKGLGVYDSVVKRYVPLPCIQGIEMQYLYGEWRTIGDENNDPTLNYWTNSVDKNGNWIMYRYRAGKPTLRYSGKIISLIQGNIKVKSKDGTAKIKVLNLTGDSGDTDHLNPRQVDHVIPGQSDHVIPEQIDHPYSGAN